MKGILVRVGYVLLGVMITLVGMFLVNEFQREEEPVVIHSLASDNEVAEIETNIEVLEEEAKEVMAETLTLDQVMEEIIELKTVSGNVLEDEQTVRLAKVKWIPNYPKNNAPLSLEENLNLKSSYDQTMEINAFDKEVIKNSTVDFSDVKITMIGDSLTAASNLSQSEAKQYAIPVLLKEILGAKEVVNLGIGGSTISRCSNSYPMVERWKDIPEDSDIIIVFGGTNDALFENKWQFGNIEYDKRMKKETFCGDLDEMLGRMGQKYRENNEEKYVKLIAINPPSTILNDGVYNIDPGNMVHQSQFAKAINEIAPPYHFEVIDMYNNNFMNTHDKQINELYMPDGVHGNPEGYRIMAEHIASEIIQRVEQ